jgi:hypothetical protein
MQPEKDSDQFLVQKREEFRNYLAGVHYVFLTEGTFPSRMALCL